MYLLTAKKFSSDIFVVHTDNPDVSIFVINDFKIFKDMLKQKSSVTAVVREIFQVTSAHTVHRVFHQTLRKRSLGSLFWLIPARNAYGRDTRYLLLQP